MPFLLDLQRVGIRKTGEVLVGMMHHFIVEEQVTQHVKAFRFHPLGWFVGKHLADHLETLDANKNAFCLEILATDEIAHAAQEGFLDLQLSFLVNALDELKSADADRVILYFGIVLVGKAEYS